MVSRLGPSRTLTERLRQRAAPVTRGAGVRGAGSLAGRAQGIIGSRGGANWGAVGRGFEDMMNHRAVEFGRQMTASPAQGQINDITGDVRGRLAQAGIYKDDLGTFQIAGMERSDPSRAIRDAAIAAMDPTGQVAQRVAFSESQLNPEGGWARPAPINRSNTAELAIPGISDVMASRVSEVGKPPADIATRTSTPATVPGTAPQSLPPGTLPRQPSGGTIPQDTTGTALPPGTLPRQPGHGEGAVTRAPAPNAVVPGSVGTLPGYPGPGERVSIPASAGEAAKPPAPVSNPFLPQGQGVGRTTTPTGAEIDPSKYPVTPAAKPPAASPSTSVTPAAQGFVGGGWRSQSSIDAERAREAANAQMTPVGGAIPGVATPTTVRSPYPMEEYPTSDILPAGLGGTGDVRPGGLSQRRPPIETPKPPAPAPSNLPPGTLPRQGGTPGTSTTPAAKLPGTPGQTPSTPGTTTASRPGGGWPTDKLGPFGTDDGGTSMFPPGFPFHNTDAPGAQGRAMDLSGLGASIQARVAEALGGSPARQAPAAGLTPIPGLEGLGDRIRAVVEGGQRELAGRMGGGFPMDLNTRLADMGLGGANTSLNAPGIAAPGTGTPPGPATNVPAPGPTTGGGGTLGSYGNQSIDQWDSAFIAAGQKYGVDPRILKAMAEIESGGNGNIGLGECRSDGSCGLMQVKPGIWGSVSSTEEQIMQAAKILADYKAANPGATDKDALFGVYFPTDDVMNGTTQGGYSQRVDELVAQMGPYDPNAVGPGGQPLPGNATTPAAPGGINAPSIAAPGAGDPSTQTTPAAVPADTQVSPGTEPLPGPTAVDNVPGGERYPINSGTLAPTTTPVNNITPAGVQQGDGLGIYAGANADESWMQLMSPDAYVSTDYKQNVCTYDPGCCNGGSCMYLSNEIYLAGATKTVHPGYDVGMAPGTTFNAPMSGTIIGTSGNQSDPRCISPGGTNECSWAYDYGIVMDGGVDPQGNQIYINYDHVTGGSLIEGQVGQQVAAGTPLGVVGQEAHIHVEMHAYCPAIGKMVVLDPSLVYGGYYQTHSVCEGHA